MGDSTQRGGAGSFNGNGARKARQAPEREEDKADLIMGAIAERRRLRVRFNGHDRVIEPHRIWKQGDGTLLLEAMQIAGGSAWAGVDVEGFIKRQLDLFNDLDRPEKPRRKRRRRRREKKERDDPRQLRLFERASHGFTRSTLGGWQGWLHIPLESLKRVELAGGPFEPREDFAADPARSLGEVITQVGS